MNTLHASFDGRYVKTLMPQPGKQVYGLHQVFGLVSESSVEQKIKAALRRGYMAPTASLNCRFEVDWHGNMPQVRSLENCKVEKLNDSWFIQAGNKSWKLATGEPTITEATESAESTKSQRLFNYLLLAFFLIAMTGIALWKPEEKVVEEEVIAPVTVVVKQVKTVTVTSAASVTKPQVKPQEVVKRAVPQELGFLGLVGKKDLSKAVGGAQLDLKASAGAGKGGSEGSGGEVLSGLGKGVRATTVGNSGVEGLGGVGTKGKGGGLGGYGDVAIASGEGRGVSGIAVSQGVGVDGGLDRHVIQATIAKYLSQVRACYEDRLRVKPGLEGTLNMDFQIGPSGRLNFSKVKSSSVGDEQVGSCVAQKMMGWEFPKPRGGVNVNVNYPFALRPVGR